MELKLWQLGKEGGTLATFVSMIKFLRLWYSVSCFSFFVPISIFLAEVGLNWGTRDPHCIWSLLSSCGTQLLLLPCDMWNLSSPTRNRSQVSCIGKQILNHCTTREVPPCFSSKKRNFGPNILLPLIGQDRISELASESVRPLQVRR